MLLNKEADTNTGIELLRIVVMLWIIAFHYVDHGYADMIKEPISVSWIIMALCRIGGVLVIAYSF